MSLGSSKSWKYGLATVRDMVPTHKETEKKDPGLFPFPEFSLSKATTCHRNQPSGVTKQSGE